VEGIIQLDGKGPAWTSIQLVYLARTLTIVG
jgi:hypothetical protein